MTYIAVTSFDDKTWNKFGLQWLRQARSSKLKGFIIGENLPEEANLKIKELGFKAVPLVGTKYQTLVDNLEDGQRCLLTQPNVFPKPNLSEVADVNCQKGSFDIFDVVTPIRSLSNRAKTIKILRKMPDLVSTSAILGTWDFWVGFLGFSNYVAESRYMEPRPLYDEAILNFFIASIDSFSLELNHG